MRTCRAEDPFETPGKRGSTFKPLDPSTLVGIYDRLLLGGSYINYDSIEVLHEFAFALQRNPFVIAVNA
jgi:hypothetical protein